MKKKTYNLLKNLRQNACVVLGLGSLSGLSIIRSLGAKRIPIIGIENHRFALSSFSKYCSSFEIADNDIKLVALLEEIGKISAYKNIIFCSNDNYLLFVDKYKEQLMHFFHLFFPKQESLTQIMNKRNMMKLAKEAGFDIPLTFYSDEHPLKEISHKISYPAIVKPLYSQGYKTKVEIINNEQNLYEIVKKERFKNGYLVQEIISGAEDNIWLIAGYCNSHSVPLALFTGYKYRQLPRFFGTATVAFSQQDKALINLINKITAFLEHIGYHGCFDIEFKKDTGEKLRFIEVNFRICDWNEMVISAGINLPYLVYCDTIGLPYPKDIKQENSILWISIIDDFITCVKYYSKDRKLILFDWIRKVFNADSYAVFKLIDIKPFIFKISLHLVETIHKIRLFKNANNYNI